MTDRHELDTPDAWVEIRDYHHVRARDRKMVLEGMAGAVDLDDNGEMVMKPSMKLLLMAASDIAEGVAAMVISAWNIPYLPDAPLPKENLGLIGDLRIEDYDKLLELVAPAVEAFMPKTVTPDDYKDPASPSVPASG